MNLIYNVKDKPKFLQCLMFAFQQLLAIMAATIAVPAIVNNVAGAELSASAALFGAGVGTIIYQLFTKFRSPVFLGSSFAFLPSMFAAFAGAASMEMGYLGIIIGAAFAALVYAVISVIVKMVGVKWINRIMPAAVIGPIVAIIGLSLAGNAVGDMMTGDVVNPKTEYVTVDAAPGSEAYAEVPEYAVADENGVYHYTVQSKGTVMAASPYAALACALVTLFVVIICSTYGEKRIRLIPFIIGILAGYALALVFTLIGNAQNIDALKIIDFTPFKKLAENGVGLSTFISVPDFVTIKAFKGFEVLTPAYIGTIAVAYVPVAFVVFAEHLADHKNLSSIIGKDLLDDPGLSNTLLGDGVGSFAGALFGGCPNTTYGESIGCVAITGNASVISITYAAVLAMIVAFIAPFVAFLDSIPACVMGGVCMTLYGFIAVSGLKMLQPVDLNDNRNLFVVSVILISGVGGMALSFVTGGGQTITVTEVACALILGIITNLMLSGKKHEDSDEPQQVIK